MYSRIKLKYILTTTSANQQENLSYGAGVEIPLRTGGTATISMPMSRTEFDGNGDELYGSDIAFSISQPLLRNAGREVNTASIKIANYNRQISEAQTKLAIINQISAVQRAYWRLYQSRRNLDVTQQQYELAQAQLDRAERQVRIGRDAEIEVTRAQSGVANRLDEIIIAQNTVLQRQRELKRTIARALTVQSERELASLEASHE